MKTLIAIILATLCLTAQASQHIYKVETSAIVLEKIHDSVLKRFTYTTGNPKDEVFTYYGSGDVVSGDCDDFASAVYYELWKLGADPSIIVYDRRSTRGWPDGYRHVIVCALNYCFDNNRKDIYNKVEFDRRVNGNTFNVVRAGYLNISKMEEMLIFELDTPTPHMYQYGNVMLASNAGGD
jgi:hypothetical protein